MGISLSPLLGIAVENPINRSPGRHRLYPLLCERLLDGSGATVFALLDRVDGGAAPGHNQVDVEPDQLGRQVAETFLASLGIAVLNDEVLALDIAEVVQTLPESLQTRIGVKGGRAGTEPTDPVHFRRLLRFGDKRRHEDTQGKRDAEHACCHWSTSSAWKSSVGGIVRPRALAALRLMTSSNLMGRSTGRSAGVAPFRILST